MLSTTTLCSSISGDGDARVSRFESKSSIRSDCADCDWADASNTPLPDLCGLSLWRLPNGWWRGLIDANIFQNTRKPLIPRRRAEEDPRLWGAQYSLITIWIYIGVLPKDIDQMPPLSILLTCFRLLSNSRDNPGNPELLILTSPLTSCGH